MNSPKLCLFCRGHPLGGSSTCATNIVARLTGKAAIVKGESKECLVVDRLSHEDFAIEDQLKSFFILTRLLDLSEEKCEQYLEQVNSGKKSSSKSCHPSDWFSLCGKCNEEVKECYKVYKEAFRWKAKFDKKKEQLKRKIENSEGKKLDEVAISLESLFNVSCGTSHPNPKSSNSCTPCVSHVVESSFQTEVHRRRRSSRIRKRNKLYSKGDEDDLDCIFDDVLTTASPHSPLYPPENSVNSDDEWQPSDTEMLPSPAAAECSDIDETLYAVLRKEEVSLTDDDEITPQLESTDLRRKRFRCKICVASYNTQGNLTHHNKIHLLPPGIIRNCDRCGWAFKSKVKRNHAENDCLAKSKLFRCSSCPAKYRLKSKYLKHILLHDSTNDTVKTRTCIKCGWVTTKKQMKNHIRKHDQEDFNRLRQLQNKDGEPEDELEIPYYCDHCHLIFPSRSLLTRHFMGAHKKTSLLECDQCPSTKFESQQLLQMHCRLVHQNECKEKVDEESSQEEEIDCLHCSEVFPTKIKRDFHIAKIHFREQLVCPICKEYKAKEFNILKNHMKKHDRNLSITCEICSRELRSDSFPGHMIRVHSIFPPNHQRKIKKEFHHCTDCPAKYQSQELYKKHLKLHKEDKNSVVHCLRCGWLHKKVIEKRSEMHYCPKGTEKSVQCNLCPAVYKSMAYIRAHHDLHEDPESVEGHFTCEKCGWLCFPSEKTSHKTRCSFKGDSNEDPEDGQQIPFYCDHCHMIYTNSNYLRQHCVNVHQKKGCFGCSFCEQKFDSTQLLDGHHLEEHSTEETISRLTVSQLEPGNEEVSCHCQHCPEQFLTRLNRDHHIAKCHQESLLRCTVCRYNASDLWELTNHFQLSKHDTENKIICHICSKAQNRNSYRFHMRALHFQNVNETELQELQEAFPTDVKFTTEQKEDQIDNEDQNCPSVISNKNCIEISEELLGTRSSIAMETGAHLPEDESGGSGAVSPHFPSSPDNCFSPDLDEHQEESLSDPNWDPADAEDASTPRKRAGTRSRALKRIIIQISSKASSSYEKRLKTNRSSKLTARIKKLRLLVSTSKTRRSGKIRAQNEVDDSETDKPVDTDAAECSMTTRGYQCTECIASYNAKQPLIVHMALHNLPPGVIKCCGKCGWAFKNGPTKVHRKLCAQSKRFQCQLCPAYYHWKRLYDKHCFLHERPNDGDVKSCVKCGWLLPISKLKSHIRKHNKEDFNRKFPKTPGTAVVDQQNKKEGAKNQGGMIKNKMDEEIPYYCDHCHLIFVSVPAFLRHFKVAHKNVQLLDCDMCEAIKFESKQLLQMHWKQVHGKDADKDLPEDTLEGGTGILACQHCSKTYATRMKLDYHIAKDHREVLLTCPVCKVYKAKEYYLLKNHMETHDQNNVTMCEICSKIIKKKTIASHMQLFHYKEVGLEPIQCKECKMIFRSTSGLKKHMDFLHLQNVPSCCHLCTKKFKNKIDLDKHIERHLNPEEHKYKKGPFFCTVCQAKFNVRQGLYYHMKKLHSDKYLYRCDNCGKGYCFENTLLDHLKSCKKS